jgi:hypothetical protein
MGVALLEVLGAPLGLKQIDEIAAHAASDEDTA